MDAYDHIQEEAYPDDPKQRPQASAPPTSASASASGADAKPSDAAAPEAANPSFAGELRDAYQTFQGSAWGTTIGSFWGSVKKQGEVYYEGAKRELADASSASRGVPVADLSSSTQTLSVSDPEPASAAAAAQPKDAAADDNKVPESLGADIMKEAGVLFSQFRSEAATGLKTVQSEAGTRLSAVQLEAGKRLKQVQKAEEAADEALIRFGSSVRDYLKDAITISAPETDPNDGTVKTLLFESKDHEGRRMVHATRFDAQLHVVHSNLDSFSKDPDSAEFAPWKSTFDAEKKTDAIAADLAKYEQLRRAMEALVPEKVDYAAFWTRYYFLRHVIEEQEQKRRDLLRAQADEEEVGWGDDDDDEPQAPATPKAGGKPSADVERDNDLLKPSEGRRSNDNSVADSDASYDIVSANASRGPGSPREVADKKKQTAKADGADSDEEDWE